VNLVTTYGNAIVNDYKWQAYTETVSGTPCFRSYEALLNVTALQRDTGISDWPGVNAKSVIALQRGSGQYNDAYVGAAEALPEPPALPLLGAGLGSLALWLRRRRAAG
jgi:hypothetical protein